MGDSQSFLNNLQSRVTVKQMLPEESKEAMKIPMVNEHINMSVPAAIKKFVHREFGQGDVADQALYGYVREPQVKHRLDQMQKKKPSRGHFLRSSKEIIEQPSSKEKCSQESLQEKERV